MARSSRALFHHPAATGRFTIRSNRIVVTNTGNVPLATFSVTDSEGLPPTCTIPPSLLVGATWTCNYSVTATAGTTTNTATADSAVTDPITDTATVTATPVPTPSLVIDKGVSLSSAGPFVASLTTTVGTTVHYRIVVTNTGNVPLTGVTLADSDSTLAGCTIPTTLAVGASFTCDYSATATLGTNPNTATADSAETPSAADTATVIADPGAVIVVTAPPTASPTITPTPTGSVAAVTSPPSPSGEVGGVTARPEEVTLPPTDADVTALSGGSSGVVPVLLVLVGLALMAGAAILARPNGRRRSDRTR